jgi:hypothetical protein
MTTTHRFTENDLFRSYWDDGLLDLLSGLAVLLTGFGWMSPLGPFATIAAPLWTVLWAPLRSRIVEPRAGFVRFSCSRRQRTRRGLWGTFAGGLGALLVLALLVFVARERAMIGPVHHLDQALPAIIVAVVASLTSLLTGARRFFLYAVILLVAAGGTALLDGGPELPLIVAGLCATTVGAGLLVRFLKQSRRFMEED